MGMICIEIHTHGANLETQYTHNEAEETSLANQHWYRIGISKKVLRVDVEM